MNILAEQWSNENVLMYPEANASIPNADTSYPTNGDHFSMAVLTQSDTVKSDRSRSVQMIKEEANLQSPSNIFSNTDTSHSSHNYHPSEAVSASVSSSIPNFDLTTDEKISEFSKSVNADGPSTSDIFTTLGTDHISDHNQMLNILQNHLKDAEARMNNDEQQFDCIVGVKQRRNG